MGFVSATDLSFRRVDLKPFGLMKDDWLNDRNGVDC